MFSRQNSGFIPKNLHEKNNMQIVEYFSNILGRLSQFFTTIFLIYYYTNLQLIK